MQVQNAIGIWGSHFAKSQITPSAAKKEEKAYQAAKTKMDAAIKASKDPKEDPKVKAATKEFEDIKRTRRERQFPLIVSAFLSAMTVSSSRTAAGQCGLAGCTSLRGMGMLPVPCRPHG